MTLRFDDVITRVIMSFYLNKVECMCKDFVSGG